MYTPARISPGLSVCFFSVRYAQELECIPRIMPKKGSCDDKSAIRLGSTGSCPTNTSNSLIESMDLLKDNRIKCQEEVKQAIDESHVNADSQNDRLREQKSQRARHVLL